MLRALRRRLTTARTRFATWLIRGANLHDVRMGTNSIYGSPGGVDVFRWTATTEAQAAGDLGMNTSTGLASVYVDGEAKSLVPYHQVRRRCRVSTEGAGNITLSGGAPLTVDGQTLSSGDLVFVVDQTDKAEHGPYTVTSAGSGSNGTWTRATTGDVASDFAAGDEWIVQEGDANAGTVYRLITTAAITLGTTDLDFIALEPAVRTDATETTVIASGALSTSYTTQSGSTDFRDHPFGSWAVECTAKSTATALTIKIDWSNDDTTFGPTYSESVSAGAATLSSYEMTVDISGEIATFRIPIVLQRRARYAKISVKADTGTPTCSAEVLRMAA